MFSQTNTYYEFGPFRVDTRERQLLRNREVVPLTPKVFDVLLALLENRGHLLTKEDVIKLVWPNTAVEEGSIARNISTLRTALGERAREHQYIETVPWRGYRFVANVREVRDDIVRPSINSIAVLPFVNVIQDPDLEYLAEGITESLINYLSQQAELKVMSRNSVFRYKDRETDASVVGRALQVQAVVLGRVAKRENMLSIGVELVDARDDSHIWGGQYIRDPEEIFTMPEKIAKEITDKLHLKLTHSQQQGPVRRQTDNAEAYHCYLKGRYYFNKLTPDGVQRGIEYFKQAIDKDPSYSLAYVGLGDCYNYWARPSDAKEAMTKALQVDDALGEAHASLGFFKFVYDWDFQGAEKELRQAVELTPSYPEAHHWSAIYFANMGRHQEAAVEARLAVELDPLSLLMNMTPGLTSYLARDYLRAEEHLLKVLELEPNFPAAHSVLGNVYVQQGLYEKGLAEYKKVMALIEGARIAELSVSALIGHAQAKAGKRSKALKILDELIKASEEADEASPIVSPHFIAEIHAALGHKDHAFEWLKKAYEQHDVQMVSLRVNPTLDSLRDDSRFGDLSQRVGLT
jgi:TolB-like protein/Tfp pilus assembly protein PilF